MNKIKTWFRNRITGLMLAFSNVEKNALGQSGELMSTDTNKYQRHTQGQLADSLINGEITQEVQNLRWRTYKILKATEGVKAEIIGYDDDGLPITRVIKKDNKRGLKKVAIDSYDNYGLEMVVDNSEIIIGSNNAIDNEYLDIYDAATINYNQKGEVVSASHGEISGQEFFASNKGEKPIMVTRDKLPNFSIEDYTKKLNVRKIDDTKKMLEFYVSKYPDDYNRSTRLFISSVKKAIENPLTASMLDINGVEFVTYKTIGSDDFLQFSYEIEKFDKIVEFNGFYVIKFIANVKINGKDIMEEHRVDELDKKYENKAKK